MNGFASSRSLFVSWKVWCETRNLAVGTETAFVDRLKDKGFEPKKTTSTRGFKGIALKVSADPSAAWDVR